MDLSSSPLSESWRAGYMAAAVLVGSRKPYEDPTDPTARARVQRARANTRRWIAAQKQLANDGQLTPLQKFFIDQIPDDWREIDVARRRRRGSSAAGQAVTGHWLAAD